MKIKLNGADRYFPSGISVEKLLSELKIDPAALAVEINGVIIKKNTFGTTTLAPGDTVEIIRFMGGG